MPKRMFKGRICTEGKIVLKFHVEERICTEGAECKIRGDTEILTRFEKLFGGGRVVRWCWINLQCRGVLQFRLQ